MQRSARTAHTIRPSRSGSSTMQPETGQAAWQIEQANAPKQRSGSITAMVFGAFFRGPDIILVHISNAIIAESAEGMARRRRADFRHRDPETQDILEDQPVPIGRKEPQVLRLRGIGGCLEALPRQAGAESVARAG